MFNVIELVAELGFNSGLVILTAKLLSLNSHNNPSETLKNMHLLQNLIADVPVSYGLYRRVLNVEDGKEHTP